MISNDSLIRTIEPFAFCKIQIENFTFSNNLEELQDGWCLNTEKLIVCFSIVILYKKLIRLMKMF